MKKIGQDLLTLNRFDGIKLSLFDLFFPETLTSKTCFAHLVAALNNLVVFASVFHHLISF